MCKTLNYFIHDNIHNIWVEITNKIVFDIYDCWDFEKVLGWK
jgi:hypothetical protein